MSKLHELLAVESNLAGQATKARTDLIGTTFGSKRHLFEEKRVTFRPNTEGAVPSTEEQRDIQSTVGKELEWFAGMFVKAVDAAHQIDIANTHAVADIVMEDGTVLVKAVPATSLLQLEKRMKEVHDLLAAVPTLDPAKGYTPDTSKGKGIYKAREVVKPRTKKEVKAMVLYEATKEHPAQVKEVSMDVEIGTVQQLEWSSLVTPALKSDMLDLSDQLIRAIRKARARANDLELNVKENTIGQALIDFVLKPLKDEGNGAK